MAWGNFCALPCPCKRWDTSATPLMLGFLPSVGVIIGAIWAALYFAAVYFGLPYLVVAFLVTFLPFALCGFLHMDGFMDCSDAILSRRPLEDRQRILKDSHTGAFAVISIVFYILAYFAFTSTAITIGIDFANMILLVCLSRSVSGLHVLIAKPMQTSQYASGFEAAQHKRQLTALAVLNVLAAAAGLLLLKSAWFTVSAIGAELFALLVCRAARKNLGGMSGDISGFSMTLGELAGLLLLLAGQGALWS